MTVHRAIWELPENHPLATGAETLGTTADENHPVAVTENVAAALLLSDEPAPLPVTLEQADGTVLDDSAHPVADDTHALIPAADETVPLPAELQHLEATLAEDHVPPSDAVFLVLENLLEGQPLPDDLSSVEATVNETHPAALDEGLLIILLQNEEHPPPAVSDMLDAYVTDDTAAPEPVDIAALIAAIEDSHAVAVDSARVVMDYTLGANAVASNAGWTSSNLAVDNDLTSTAASILATSSGIGGLTSNTTNGDMRVDLPNVTLPVGWTLSNQKFRWYVRVGRSGGALVDGSPSPSRYIDLYYAVSGGADVGVARIQQTGVGVGFQDAMPFELDASSILTSETIINSANLRFIGRVISGTGSGAQTYAYVFGGTVAFTLTSPEL